MLWAIIWDLNKTIDVVEWSICGGGRIERFYCTFFLLITKLSLSIPVRNCLFCQAIFAPPCLYQNVSNRPCTKPLRPLHVCTKLFLSPHVCTKLAHPLHVNAKLSLTQYVCTKLSLSPHVCTKLAHPLHANTKLSLTQYACTKLSLSSNVCTKLPPGLHGFTKLSLLFHVCTKLLPSYYRYLLQVSGSQKFRKSRNPVIFEKIYMWYYSTGILFRYWYLRTLNRLITVRQVY